MLRFSTWVISIAAHAALAAPFLLAPDVARKSALDLGTGEDAIRIEMGLPIEGVASVGTDEMTVAAIDTTPAAAIAARPELQAIEAVKPPPIEPPPPDVVETVEVSEPPPVQPPPPDLEVAREPEPELQDLIVARAEPVPTSVPPPLVTAAPPPPLTTEPPPLETAEPPPPISEPPPPPDVTPLEEPPPLEQTETPQLEQVATAAQMARIAVQEQVAAGAKKEGGEAQAKAIQQYMGDMYRYIQGFRVYPRSKKNGRKRTGKVMVAVTLNSDGSVAERRVTSSSGDRFVDRAALKWIDKATPFPAMPEEAAASPIVVEIPFNFSVR
ncbi:MAG: TonB family protein [Pseudomonadota bacterium]